MKKIKEKIENAMLRAKLAMTRFATEERGDTNFVSIAIILVIVITVAIAFIAMKDQVLGWLTDSVDELGGALGK